MAGTGGYRAVSSGSSTNGKPGGGREVEVTTTSPTTASCNRARESCARLECERECSSYARKPHSYAWSRSAISRTRTNGSGRGFSWRGSSGKCADGIRNVVLALKGLLCPQIYSTNRRAFADECLAISALIPVP